MSGPKDLDGPALLPHPSRPSGAPPSPKGKVISLRSRTGEHTAKTKFERPTLKAGSHKEVKTPTVIKNCWSFYLICSNKNHLVNYTVL